MTPLYLSQSVKTFTINFALARRRAKCYILLTKTNKKRNKSPRSDFLANFMYVILVWCLCCPLWRIRSFYFLETVQHCLGHIYFVNLDCDQRNWWALAEQSNESFPKCPASPFTSPPSRFCWNDWFFVFLFFSRQWIFACCCPILVPGIKVTVGDTSLFSKNDNSTRWKT